MVRLINGQELSLAQLKQIKMCFVLCAARSGSTLLNNRLNHYTQVVGLHEHKFFLCFYKRFNSHKNFSVKEIDFIIDNLWNYHFLFEDIWKIDKLLLRENLLANADHLDFSDLLKIIYLHHYSVQYKKDVRVIVDKLPLYYEFLEELELCFPNSKYIWLIRNPKGVLSSHKKMKKGIPNNQFIKLSKWINANTKISKFIEDRKEQTMNIRYEDMMRDFDSVMHKITHFLHVDNNILLANYEINSINSLKIKNELYNEQSQSKFNQQHDNSSKDIISNNANAWKSLLSKGEIKMIDYYLTNGKFNLFGYEDSISEANYKELPKLKYLTALLMYILSKFLPNNKAIVHRMGIIKNPFKFMHLN